MQKLFHKKEMTKEFRENKIQKLYKQLQLKYGGSIGQWKFWRKKRKTSKEKQEIMIAAILTQHTIWNNVDLAINRLKRANLCSLRSIYQLGEKNKKVLAGLIKPSGFYQQKTNYLIGLARFFIQNYQGLEQASRQPIEKIRSELLNQKGVGPETADSILLYALEKPVFVIDEYTRRLVKEKRLAKNLSYDFLQKLFEKNLKKDYRLYQDFHALIVIAGKSSNKNIKS